MPISLVPRYRARSVADISPAFLKARGIRLLMLDFDNTLVPYTNDEPTELVLEWIRKMQETDIQLCVVSNSKRDRVKKFCAGYGIDCITHAKKPFPKGIRQCLAKYSIPAENCALVGDQIYTDTLGANGCNVQSILVTAIDNHNFWLKARHVLEKPFIFAARKRRVSNEKHG